MKTVIVTAASVTILLCAIHFAIKLPPPGLDRGAVNQEPIQPPPPFTPEPQPEPDPEPITPEPEWKEYPPVRSFSDSSLGDVLLDIESHMPAGHIYRDSDKVTWAHETTHGINSHLRMKFSELYYAGAIYQEVRLVDGKPVMVTSVPINGFYCGNNRAAIIQEPNMRKSRVAQYVPQSLRGGVFGLYVSGQTAWDDRPLYLYDEWVSYRNGSRAGLDLHSKNLWGNRQRSETVLYMLEFNVYAIATCMAIQKYDPEYADVSQLKNFTMWLIDDAMKVYQESKGTPFSNSNHDSYLEEMRTGHNAENLREFARGYFGEDWCLKILGF